MSLSVDVQGRPDNLGELLAKVGRLLFCAIRTVPVSVFRFKMTWLTLKLRLREHRMVKLMLKLWTSPSVGQREE